MYSNCVTVYTVSYPWTHQYSSICILFSNTQNVASRSLRL